MKKVLIVKVGAIGDVIMALPILEELRRTEPNCRVDWIVGKVAAPILQTVVDVNLRLLYVDEKALFRGNYLNRLIAIIKVWGKVALSRYDKIMILNSDLRYGILVFPSLGPRIWFRNGGIFRAVVPARHHSVEYVRLHNSVDDACIPTPKYPNIRLPEIPNEIHKQLGALVGKKIVLSPAGSKNVMREDGLRRWPIDNYRSLVHLLKKHGYRVILVGGPGDEWASNAIGGECDLDIIGKLKLPQFLRFISSVDLVITHDSGPLHMADLVCTPVVGIFGPTMPRMFGPIFSPYRIIKCIEKMNCQPCYDGRNYANCTRAECMARVSPQSVMDAAVELLEEVGEH